MIPTQNRSVRIRTFTLYYLLFILIPFSQSIPLFAIAGREVNIGMHTLVIVLILFLTFAISSARLRLLKEPSTISLMLLACWSFITIIASLRFAPASVVANSFITWLRWVQFIPIMCLLVYGTGDEGKFKRIVQILIIIGLFVAGWGIYETVYPSEFATTYFRGAVTFTKPLFREHELDEVINANTGYYMGSANYNIAGMFSAIAAIIAIPFLFKNNAQGKKNKYILFSFSATILLVIGVIVTQSRSAFFCLIAGILVSSKSTSTKRFLATVVCFVLLIVIFGEFFLKSGFGSMIYETITYLPRAIPLVIEAEDYSGSMDFSINVFGAANRALTIFEAFRMFIESPFLGCGFFGFSYHSLRFGTAENFFAQMLAETGAFGFTLLVIFLFSVWRYTKTHFKTGSFAYTYQIGFRGAFIASIITNLTGTLFYDQRIWGLFLVLIAIQIRLVRDERSRVKLQGEVP